MNQIEQKLDQALEQAKDRVFVNAIKKYALVVGNDPDDGPVCIMFWGQTGSGKTSMIRQWAEDHKAEIIFVELDAARPYVQSVNGHDTIFSSSEIETMSKPDTVLFIDNYQYLKKDVSRQLNRLLDHKIVIDPAKPEEQRTLNNLLLVVASMTY